MTRKKVLVLGCTGSIGKSTIDIIRKNPGLYEIAGLSAYSKEKELLDIAHEFSVGNTAIVCPPPDGSPLVRYRGTESVAQLIRDSGADIAVNGIAGAGGLLPSIQVLECGMDMAPANTKRSSWRVLSFAGSQARKNAEYFLSIRNIRPYSHSSKDSAVMPSGLSS